MYEVSERLAVTALYLCSFPNPSSASHFYISITITSPYPKAFTADKTMRVDFPSVLYKIICCEFQFNRMNRNQQHAILRRNIIILKIPNFRLTSVRRCSRDVTHTVYPVTPNAGMFYQRGYKQSQNIRREKM